MHTQTILSFPRAIPMAKGDELTGSISCRPAAIEDAQAVQVAAQRALPTGMLDVDVEVSFKGLVARVGYKMRRPPPPL